MKTTTMAMLAACALTLSQGALQAAEMTQADDQMGLSKTSVFDNPSPDVFAYPETKPADASGLPRAYIGAPPQVPHSIANLLPISAKRNKCLGCHDDTEMIGKKRDPGVATPMPASHYHKAADGSLTFSDTRYVCVQCHTPQADVKELVGNTFRP